MKCGSERIAASARKPGGISALTGARHASYLFYNYLFCIARPRQAEVATEKERRGTQVARGAGSTAGRARSDRALRCG